MEILMQALGMIEVYGYLAAVEALDCALKTANVKLLELTKVKGGLVTVMVTGDVAAAKAAMDAAAGAAARVGEVISVHVIARPASDIDKITGLPHEGRDIADDNREGGEGCGGDSKNLAPDTEAFDKRARGDTKPRELNRQDLERMTVENLRSIARETEPCKMTKKEIRFAKKNELIQKILECTEENG